jgi:hypothetical protein
VHPRDVGRIAASSVLYVEVQNRVALEAVVPEAVSARRLESYQRVRVQVAGGTPRLTAVRETTCSKASISAMTLSTET